MNISIAECKAKRFSWETWQIFLIKMQPLTAYSNQRLKPTDMGEGEERKKRSKYKLTSFEQQSLCELQDLNCKFSFGENFTSEPKKCLRGIYMRLAKTP